MSNERITRHVLGAAPSRTDWTEFDALTDDEITKAVADDPDAAPLVDEAWAAGAELVEPGKVPVSIRLDREVVEFFKQTGPRYQTRMNAVLKAYVRHEMKRRNG